VEGVIEPSQIVQKLCDCGFFISSRRSSAIAGIACGLPVIAYHGSETVVPVTDAGVLLVSPDQPDDLHFTLVRVLSDDVYRLAAPSRAAYETRRFITLIYTR